MGDAAAAEPAEEAAPVAEPAEAPEPSAQEQEGSEQKAQTVSRTPSSQPTSRRVRKPAQHVCYAEHNTLSGPVCASQIAGRKVTVAGGEGGNRWVSQQWSPEEDAYLCVPNVPRLHSRVEPSLPLGTCHLWVRCRFGQEWRQRPAAGVDLGRPAFPS